jgi:hypothetical protein
LIFLFFSSVIFTAIRLDLWHCHGLWDLNRDQQPSIKEWCTTIRLRYVHCVCLPKMSKDNAHTLYVKDVENKELFYIQVRLVLFPLLVVCL